MLKLWRITVIQRRFWRLDDPSPPPYDGKLNRLFEKIQKLRSSKGLEDLRPGVDIAIQRPLRATIVRCSPNIANPYIPSQSSSIMSLLKSRKNVSAKINASAAALYARRKIRQSDGSFSQEAFLEESQRIYIQAHKCLADGDKITLHSLVTEACYPLIRQSIPRFHRIIWNYVENITPSYVVHTHLSQFLSMTYAQITVHFHHREIFAEYDRYGRLIRGDPENPHDILEYIVFEKQLDADSNWRMHGKIVPSWAPSRPLVRNPSVVSDVDFTKFGNDRHASIKKEIVDTDSWNEKWSPPPYYELTYRQRERLKARRHRKFNMFNMKPMKRV